MGFFGGGGGTTPVNMVGASTGTAGTAGYVPAPAAGKNTRYLSSDASFGEVPMLPQYKNTQSGHWIGPYMGSYSSGQISMTANSRRFLLTYVPSSGEIDTLGIRVATVAPTADRNVHVGLWECAENGEPSNFVIGGIITTGTTSSVIRSVSISNTSVSRGFYYLSVTPESTDSGALGAFSVTSSFGMHYSVFGSNSLGGNPNTFYYTTTSYTQSTHATFTIGNPSGGPYIASFQYV
jgi:hypothetical protein